VWYNREMSQRFMCSRQRELLRKPNRDQVVSQPPKNALRALHAFGSRFFRLGRSVQAPPSTRDLFMRNNYDEQNMHANHSSLPCVESHILLDVDGRKKTGCLE
jgi:hypothetical protein